MEIISEVISDPVLSTIEWKQNMVRDLLSRNIKSIQFIPSPFAALFACGKSTGLVLDIGHQESTIVPVYDGKPLFNHLVVSKAGGQSISNQLQMSISNQLQMDAESLEALTAQICCASLGIVPKDIILPLGLVTIPGHVRTLATEILFDPNYDPLHVATWKCIASLPVDIRRDIISNLLVIGGPAMLPGVIDRFFQEMKAISDPNLQHLIPYLHIIETPFPPNRHASIGAALFQAAGFQSSYTVDVEEFKKSKKVPDWTNYQN